MDQLLKDTLLGMNEVSRAGLNAGLEIGRRDELARAKPLLEALETIAHGLTGKFPGAPDPMTANSPAEFQAAMWTWSQATARAAIAAYQREGK